MAVKNNLRQDRIVQIEKQQAACRSMNGLPLCNVQVNQNLLRSCLYGEKLAREPEAPFPRANRGAPSFPTLLLINNRRLFTRETANLARGIGCPPLANFTARLYEKNLSRVMISCLSQGTEISYCAFSAGHPILPTEWPYPQGRCHGAPGQLFSI